MPGTRIVIIRKKELWGIGAFIAVGILLLLGFVLFYERGQSDSVTPTESTNKYRAGVYTKEIQMGETSVNLQVSLDENQVKSVDIVPLEESVTTLYPLVEPAVETISQQLQSGMAIQDITASEETQYTESMILTAVEEMITAAMYETVEASQ